MSTPDSVNIHEAKTHLSRLLRRVEQGEEIVLARSGRPVARLVPIERRARRLGIHEGRIAVADDFDAPLPEEIQGEFEGRS